MNDDPTQAWIDQQERSRLREKERRDVSAQIMAGLVSNPEFLARNVSVQVVDAEATREVFDQVAAVAVMATDALLDALRRGESQG